MRFVSTLLGTTTIVAGLTVPAAAADHTDVFSCYAYVHEQCFPGGKDAGCGKDGYNDALDECDGYYEDSATRPTSATTFSARTNPQVKARIMSTFKMKGQ